MGAALLGSTASASVLKNAALELPSSERTNAFTSLGRVLLASPTEVGACEDDSHVGTGEASCDCVDAEPVGSSSRFLRFRGTERYEQSYPNEAQSSHGRLPSHLRLRSRHGSQAIRAR